jgi:membrane protease YdiL (CAAX protease family)
VAAYFTLAYLLSWPFFILVLVVFPDSIPLQAVVGSLAVFAPAFGSMIVGAVAEPARVRRERAAHWTAFLTTWAVAWATLVLFASRVRGAPISGPLIVFGGVVALLPAFTASRAFSRVVGIQRHFRTLIVPRGNVWWYLFALLAFPAIQLAGVGITRALADGTGSQSELTIAVDPILAILLFANGFFFAGGINEESGWRGFALPRLQRRYCPLVAALIVWVFWALWHLPVDLASDDSAGSILTNRLFFNAMWSILFMWVFNRTKGSMLAPAIFHPAMNASGTVLPRTGAATLLFAIVVLIAVVGDRMWRRLPSRHPALAMHDSEDGTAPVEDHTEVGTG